MNSLSSPINPILFSFLWSRPVRQPCFICLLHLSLWKWRPPPLPLFVGPLSLRRVLLHVASTTKNQSVAKGTRLECMHAKENEIDDINHVQHWLKLKKPINNKPNIKVKFRSHHWISNNKNFETRSHLTIFWQAFLFIFLIMLIYSVITRTKRMKCQNKREQLSEQVYMSSRTTNMVSEQCRTRVRHMLLL
jgi:hypothetical protein